MVKNIVYIGKNFRKRFSELNNMKKTNLSMIESGNSVSLEVEYNEIENLVDVIFSVSQLSTWQRQLIE
jgi:hypothetical protein